MPAPALASDGDVSGTTPLDGGRDGVVSGVPMPKNGATDSKLFGGGNNRDGAREPSPNVATGGLPPLDGGDLSGDPSVSSSLSSVEG